MSNQASALSGTRPGKDHNGPAYILVVDDNHIVTRTLSSLLRHAGHQAVVFHSGLPALQFAQKHGPVAAIIDIHLPDISGLVVTQRLRDYFGPARPILIISGDTSMEDLNSLAHVGATYFFAKPLKAPQLVQRLNELLIHP